MTSMKSLLLASSALFAAATMMPAQAAPAEHTMKVAQAQSDHAATDKDKKKKKEDHKKKADKTNKKEGKKAEEKASEKANGKKADNKEDNKKAKAGENKGTPPHKSETGRPGQTQPAASQKQPAASSGKQSEDAGPDRKPGAPHPAQAAPAAKPAAPKTTEKKAPPPDKQAAPGSQPETKQQPTAQQKRPEQKQAEPKQQPAAHKQQPAAQPKQSKPTTLQAAPTDSQSKPAPTKTTESAPSGKSDAASATTLQLEPAKPQDAREFIRKGDKQPERTIKDVQQQRRTTREGGRTLIHEGDRVIVRERDRTFIRHNEDRRFAIGARNVRTDRRDGETITVIVRPNGVRIITVTDRHGHLIRRVRRNPNGREVVIIDNRRAGRRDVFLDVRPPRIRMPRHRYIVDADRADERQIYDVLVAPPVQEIDRDYSLAQVRYNSALREYMRRLDLDIHFDTGSWQITPAQMDRLSLVAEAMNRAIDRNPREVFLIEGHTDAIGSDEDNLSLSDRRAEAVAVALTEGFHVPAENLVTQGYGEQELKVQTQEASRANRRVAVRRITPLINRTARR